MQTYSIVSMLVEPDGLDVKESHDILVLEVSINLKYTTHIQACIHYCITMIRCIWVLT